MVPTARVAVARKPWLMIRQLWAVRTASSAPAPSVCASAQDAGLLILPQALLMGVLTPIAGRLYTGSDHAGWSSAGW